MSTQTHQPAGTPTGGQFATSARGEADVVLEDTRVDDTTEKYLVTAMWSSTDEDGDPLDQNYSVDDLAPEALASARADVASFLEANAELIDQAKELKPGYDDGQVAHDFWLTRNGHGAGFWDRGLGTVGDELTKNAKPYGDANLYVGDDNLVYLQ